MNKTTTAAAKYTDTPRPTNSELTAPASMPLQTPTKDSSTNQMQFTNNLYTHLTIFGQHKTIHEFRNVCATRWVYPHQRNSIFCSNEKEKKNWRDGRWQECAVAGSDRTDPSVDLKWRQCFPQVEVLCAPAAPPDRLRPVGGTWGDPVGGACSADFSALLLLVEHNSHLIHLAS